MTATSTIVRTARHEPGLLGQTVVVIGGSAGMGLETARLARAEGADVILAAWDPERLRGVDLELGAVGASRADEEPGTRARADPSQPDRGRVRRYPASPRWPFTSWRTRRSPARPSMSTAASSSSRGDRRPPASRAGENSMVVSVRPYAVDCSTISRPRGVSSHGPTPPG
jgi:hypothetical protein